MIEGEKETARREAYSFRKIYHEARSAACRRLRREKISRTEEEISIMIAFILGNLCIVKKYVRTPIHARDDAHSASRYPIHAISKVVIHSFQ
jgi:hypothetical protein